MEQMKKVEVEDKLSHYLQTTNKYGIPVNVPVIDVRDGLAERMLAYNMIKQNNRSKFMNYSQYNQSPRKTQSI